MDTKKAALECIPLLYKTDLPDDKAGCAYSKNHLYFMCNEIISGNVVGEKSHRWLGWIQACLNFGGAATLEELKNINHIS